MTRSFATRGLDSLDVGGRTFGGISERKRYYGALVASPLLTHILKGSQLRFLISAEDIMFSRTLLAASMLSLSFQCDTSAGGGKKGLSADDKAFLDGLMKDFLFDPRGAQRVSVKVVVRSVWGGDAEGWSEGWLVRSKDGDRVHFTDGWSIPAPGEEGIKMVDFIAACKIRYAPPAKKDVKDKEDDPFGDRDDVFRRMRETAVGAVRDADLTLAAWLYRLGEEELASHALAAARKDKEDPRTNLRADLAWVAFAGMVHAYMVRADEEALGHGERLLRLYPEQTKEGHFKRTPLALHRKTCAGAAAEKGSCAGGDRDDSWPAVDH
jgi:hypothetical protein